MIVTYLGRTTRLALAALALTTLALPQAFASSAKEEGKGKESVIVIGTGGVRGVYYPAGGAICRFVTRGIADHNLRCFPESTGGSLYNVQSLREGKLDFGITQSDWQYHAYHGSSEFEKSGAYSDLRAVFSLHSEPFTVVARKDASIEHFDDLKGKRVNIVNQGSGSRATMEVIMKQKGWTNNVFRQTSEMRATEQGQALCDNKIDAFVHATGHPNGLLQEVTSSCDAVLVDVSGQDVAKLLEDKPYYTKANVPGGMYKGTDHDIPTFGIRATLVTSAAMPDETVYQLVKAVFENFDDFKTLHPVFSTLKKEEMISLGNTAPLHPGAIRYYKEAGLMDDAGKVIPPKQDDVVKTEAIPTSDAAKPADKKQH